VKKLILWDIDGTLLRTGRAGIIALTRAFAQLHGREPDMAKVEVAGRTDKWITARMLEENALPVTPANVHDLVDAYLALLPQEISTRPGLVLPGIQSLLDTLRARTDVAQGLLTGNVERGARIKLEHYGVWHYFEFGAFGDDSALRNDLGPHALRRAKEKHAADFDPANTFIIGDTPHDIECGKVIGAKTVAVATGSYSVPQLQAHAPTAVFPNFANTEAFLQVIDSAY
jgi:phosphoglycolate phosphatase